MRTTRLLSTAAVVALAMGAAPVLAQSQPSGSSSTAPGQIKPPATSSEMPGTSESAPGQNRPSASSDAPGKSEAAPGQSQRSTASSNPDQMKKAPGGNSSSQDTSSTSSTNTSEQNSRPAAAGAAGSSQNANQASDSQKRPQQGSSQSATSSQDSPKAGSGTASQTATDSKARPAAGAAQQQSTQSGSSSSAQQSGSTTQQGAATQQSNSAGTSSSTTSAAVANLSTQQRSEVTQAFSSTNVNTVSNVNFNISVGTTITNEVHLAPLPAEVVRLVPQYRGYEYVVVRDEIVIVEPKTKKIVEVIHKSGGSRKSASVNLSSDQRKKFKTSVETTGSTRATSTRIEIHEGEVLPDDVSLMDVPETVITEVPELQTYRYVVVGDEIAIVEPDTRRVIEVIQ